MPSGSLQSGVLQSRFRVGCGLLFSALLAFSSHAAEPQIRVYAESFAADSRVVETSDGSFVEGYGSDFIRAVIAEAGLTADILVVPLPRLMYFLQNEPNVLGFNMTSTPEREDQIHWIGEIRPVNFTYGTHQEILRPTLLNQGNQ